MYPPHHFGGYELVWRSATQHLERHGHEVHVLTTGLLTDSPEPDDPQGPTKVYQYELDSLPAIPASTLRGLISGIVEASSNSALRVLANRVYSFRKKAAPGEALTEIGMAVEAAGDGHYGLLPLRYLKIKLDHPESYKTFSLDDPRYYYMPKGEKHGTRQRPLTEGEYDSLPGNKKGHDRGILRVMRGADSLACPIHTSYL